MATALVNVAFGFGSSMVWFSCFWALNGILQVMLRLLLAAAGSRVLSQELLSHGIATDQCGAELLCVQSSRVVRHVLTQWMRMKMVQRRHLDVLMLQGFGGPCCARILTAWFASKERGTYWGMWNIAHNLGGFSAPVSSLSPCLAALLTYDQLAHDSCRSCGSCSRVAQSGQLN